MTIMMTETVMKWIGGICFLSSLAFPGYILLLCKRKKGIPRKPTEQLREMILKPNNTFLYAPAIRELVARGEDVTAALLNVIDMLQSENKLIRKIGWGIITEHFPVIEGKVEFDAAKPSEQTRLILNELRESFAHE